MLSANHAVAATPAMITRLPYSYIRLPRNRSFPNRGAWLESFRFINGRKALRVRFLVGREPCIVDIRSDHFRQILEQMLDADRNETLAAMAAVRASTAVEE